MISDYSRRRDDGPLNRKYLRADHDYKPITPPTCARAREPHSISLSAGDMVIVHLTDVTGWAEGTVLNTGARGWFPSNYCRPYDHPNARTFFHALTSLWTWSARILDPSSSGERQTSNGYGEVQALVAGVRRCLELSRCLRREDDVARKSKDLAELRHNLLANLSVLVKPYAMSALSDGSQVSPTRESITQCINQAYKIAVELVRFIDTWWSTVGSQAQETACPPDRPVLTKVTRSQEDLIPAVDGLSPRLSRFRRPITRADHVRASSENPHAAVRVFELPDALAITSDDHSVGHTRSERSIADERTEAVVEGQANLQVIEVQEDIVSDPAQPQSASVHSATSDPSSAWRASASSIYSTDDTGATTPELSSPAFPTLLSPPDLFDSPRVLQDSIEADRHFPHELIVGPSGNIIGGSAEALVEHMVHRTSKNREPLVRTLFLAAPHFTTGDGLANVLASQYKLLRKRSHPRFDLQNRTLELISHWLSQDLDPDSANAASSAIRAFLDDADARISPTWQQILLDKVRNSEHRSSTKSTKGAHAGSPSAPSLEDVKPNQRLRFALPLSNDLTVITDFSPLEIAHQLTYSTSAIFRKIKARHLFSASQSTYATGSPLHELATATNGLSYFVTTSILASPHAKFRAKILKHWIRVASACSLLENYQSLFAIMSSFDSAAIFRLGQTWGLLSQDLRNTCQDLRELISRNRNFANLRIRLNKTLGPCIPFMGIYLSDLLFIEKGLPTVRSLIPTTGREQAPKPVVNFEKYKQTFEVVMAVEKLQARRYAIKPASRLQDWLASSIMEAENATRDSDWAFIRSNQLESRIDDKKGNRLLRKETNKVAHLLKPAETKLVGKGGMLPIKV